MNVVSLQEEMTMRRTCHRLHALKYVGTRGGLCRRPKLCRRWRRRPQA